ncbi:hypothetical protein [Amycolatopsis jejuensis]|uniref:hypothetical protein n=1 Tax=Amycolatopsis jejuensis TaxID=330084 RepID=UPI0012E0BD59|nr:hypothetical protein [Amycolatopsis jejuensis]
MTPLLALAAWIAGAALGLTMLVGWLRSGSQPPPPLLYVHLTSAVAGLVLWIVYLASDRPVALAWVAFGLLFVINGLGDTLTMRLYRQRSGTAGPLRDIGRAGLAQLHRPKPFVHAFLAPVTFVSVLLAALGVGV